MGLTFTRAPIVTPGTRPTSTHICALADAANDRLRAGPGDSAWRLYHFHLNQWRQVRNPSGFAFPAQAEFLDSYLHIDPASQKTWPTAGPGEAEGANLASPWMQFVHGNSVLGPEADRINDIFPFHYTGDYINDADYFWRLGIQQRGGYDPTNGAQNWPAGEAAQNFFQIAFPPYSPHGKTYGGYFPRPTELLTDCGATPDLGQGVPSYQVKFTALRSGVAIPVHHGTAAGSDPEVITYAGTCPCGTTSHAAGHVLGIARMPFAFYVYVATGSGCTYNVDTYPIADWVEGPYTGTGDLQHDDAGHIERGIFAFGLDFRGTPAQRGGHGLLGDLGAAGTGSHLFQIEQTAFPWERFLTRQYALAPARAYTVGSTIEIRYPHVEWSGSLTTAEPIYGKFITQSETHYLHDDFSVAGVFVRATGLVGRATVEFCDGTTIIAALTVEGDAFGRAAGLYWFPDAVRPNPLKIRLQTRPTLTATGKIEAEAAELLTYQPQTWDGYLAARVAASHGVYGSISAGVDGRGIDTAQALDIGENLFRYGCVPNLNGVAAARSPAEWVNDNPVFDSARRLTRDHIRKIRRQNLVGYEVTGSGECNLYFKRFGFGSPSIDLFHNIAPPVDPIPSGDLVEGETYLVRSASGSGSITYLGEPKPHGATFTATADATFETIGDALLYVRDGIRHTALKKGWTNEWLIWLETKVYNHSPTSIWKEEAYPDYYAHCNRCLFYGGYINSARFRRHINYNTEVQLDGDNRPTLLPSRVMAQSIAPEAPTGYRYASDSNRYYGSSDFWKSCQVMVAPYEITSCTVDEWGAEPTLKLTLSRRLDAYPSAPSTVARDISTWSAGEKTDLAAETYRTDDNAIREYLLHQTDNTKHCSAKTGDCGTGSSVFGLPDNPHGSCYPDFQLAHLVSKPYEDDNDRPDPSHDSRRLVDTMLHLETILRATCEGFVDGITSIEQICSDPLYSGGLYDYTFRNLCADAGVGAGWIPAVSLAARPDAPSGHGPLPATKPYAEIFNNIARCFNLLDKVRLELPTKFQYNQTTYTGERAVDADGHSCGSAGAWVDGASLPGASTLYSAGTWLDGSGCAALHYGGLGGCPHKLQTIRQSTQYRIRLDPITDDVLPAAVKDLVDNDHAGVFVRVTETIYTDRRTLAADAPSSQPCGSPPPVYPFNDPVSGQYMVWVDSSPDSTVTCYLTAGGTLNPAAPPPADVFLGWDGISTCANSAQRGLSLSVASGDCTFIQIPLT